MIGVNPIYVPSKGRAGTSNTIKHLLAEGIPFTVFLEPQDVENYREAYGTEGYAIAILEKNDMGLVYSRNAILDYAQWRGDQWIWMLDDDINMMGTVIEGKVVKRPWHIIMMQAQEVQDRFSNLALMGLEYQQFAWSQKKPYTFNSYADTAVALHAQRLKSFRYRTEFKHDRDMVLQLITMGYLTLRTSWFCFGSPKNGSNKGGLYDKYKAGKEAAASAEMVKLWPGVCKLNTKKDGRPDVKVNWALFKTLAPKL